MTQSSNLRNYKLIIPFKNKVNLRYSNSLQISASNDV